jgi:hypothetical protein
MSQNKQFSFVNDTSSDVFNNSNNGWANFETFDQNSEVKDGNFIGNIYLFLF